MWKRNFVYRFAKANLEHSHCKCGRVGGNINIIFFIKKIQLKSVNEKYKQIFLHRSDKNKMRYKIYILTLLTIINQQLFSQAYPTFGPEKGVTINGLNFDAMEPFISLDGNTLFFNSLNSGGNTNLYYATKINDTTFTYIGLVGGTYDPSPNHLDGVASMDSINNFFWVSLRGYPSPMENLHRGVYANGNVSSITRVYGNFNIYTFNFPFGWLIMDAAINYQGDLLYYCNAKFDFSNTICAGVPCESKIGVAQKINDSTFNKHPNSNAIFSNVNDTVNYLIYAPQVTKDGLELYYTRLKKGSINTEICVSVRNSTVDTFSLPVVIYSNMGFVPEAASPSADKQKIYYHKKNGAGTYKIYLRFKTGTVVINEHVINEKIKVYPNPANNIFNIDLGNSTEHFTVSICSLLGQELFKASNKTEINISNYLNGIYFLIIKQKEKIYTTKIIKN